MVSSKPKKPKKDVVQAIVPQGAGKRPEAQVRDPNTGGSKFVRLEDSGLPRNEVASIVQKSSLEQTQKEIIDALNRNPETPQVQEIPQDQQGNLLLDGVNVNLPQNDQNVPGEKPLQTPAELLSQSSSPIVSGLGKALEAGGEFLGIPKPQTEEATPEQITSAVGSAVAVGASVATGQALLAAAGRKLAVRSALNTAPEAGHFIKRYLGKAGKILFGKAPVAGKLSANKATTGLLQQIGLKSWGGLLIPLASWNFIKEVISDPEDSTAWDRVENRISDAIIANNKAMETEDLPGVLAAYQQEQENLLKIREDLLNPEAWDRFLLDVPYIDDLKARKLLSKARDRLTESELRRAKINIEKSRAIAERAGIINTLSPDAREFLLDLTDKEKENLNLARASLGGR